ncbi:hypothetical protein [Fuscibacter oryzae]|uniref:Uncharacterized protein n=1 Tax=Fuscibacter oryzae TaxID=2803939 RepID=A0A8J7SVH3_9RHOB|nr:hypothetical protein [Fuscibacter oryzae]MBL4929522.1 hypothetical protein [Fuscibacter oryzae]
MSRFRMPPRIAPSPAAEEPGQQNAVARLRSSREAQSRLLAERRDAVKTEADVFDRPSSVATVGLADRAGMSGKREREVELARSGQKAEVDAAKGAKVKLVLLYRVPPTLQPDLAVIAGRDGVTMEYILGALAREARKTLRALSGEADIRGLTEAAASLRRSTEGVKLFGNPMTVYVRPEALQAMHRAAADPWCSLPRATVVGAYFTAIVARLIRARRVG